MDIKFLSRKFLLSVILAVLATLFMWGRFIEPVQWQWVIMATVVSYVTAKTLEKKTASDMTGQMDWVKKADVEKRINIVTIWDRLKALLSREFAISIVTIVIASAFLYRGIIPGSVWFAISTALAAAFNIGNSISKL